ncbi:MAG TPA: hypothetical protein VL128_10190 [Candidatus Eisenbacteria bacterium]|nr:hypothetical protein [Candidatus Eisenbacteria bacterium]
MKFLPPLPRKPPRNSRRRGFFLFLGILLCGASSLGRDSRAHFFPKLQRGESLEYEVHGRLDRIVKTESRISSMRGPQQLQGDLSARILLGIQEFRSRKHQPWVAAQTQLLPAAGALPVPTSAKPLNITFDILSTGQLGGVTGLDALSPEQRLLWQFWVARFAFGWTLPPQGMKPGEKWKYDDPELDTSLIAELVWQREITYARDDKCPVLPAETCAVFLTQSTLKQKSSTKDSTPEDFRLHDLKTSGTARGQNQVITYVSRKTGLVLRATEDVQQSMDVTVMKTDGTNGVHYAVDATSHLETLFVPQPAALTNPPASNLPPAL